ncbi:MAG: Dabb family protein [Clostridiales bacterium]|jgi:hypothetical protein|nr:Dabb family protein [Clostridiales bacterium]
MVKHIVLFKLKDQKDRQTAVGALLSMKGRIEGLLDLEVGADFLGSGRSYDVALTTTHTDRAALDVYQAHPVHLPVKEIMRGIRENSVSLDYEVTV